MKSQIFATQWSELPKDVRLDLLAQTRFRDILKMRPNLEWHHSNGRVYCHVTWVDHLGRKMEWHTDDALRLRDAIIWYLCQSPNKTLRRLGKKMWDNP